MPQPDHLIAGQRVPGETTFASDPAHGPAADYACATPAHVAAAAAAAEAAFPAFAALPAGARARFLDRIADEVEARGPELTDIAHRETGLPIPRLEGERGRTTGQLRLFAAHIRAGRHLDLRTDAPLPDRLPAPRPGLRMVQRPVGPVAVFGASNFPLAFSTAGGDTASALAAGCPVVVKGHPAHPGTGAVVAAAVAGAAQACGLPAGVFSYLQGGGADGGRAAGAALVTDPRICAVGFTGSLAAGRALFDLCAARPDPIPFFGELGSVNPVFLLPAALALRPEALAAGWAASLTLGAGQFCTNPGLVLLIDGPDADRFVAAARAALADAAAQTMLTAGIAAAYRQGCDRMAGAQGVRSLLAPARTGPRQALPALCEVSAADFLADPALAHEVFGPLGLIVRARHAAEVLDLARGLRGQLTCTLHLEDGDSALARHLLPVLERKAGRILANGFPTGVEVAEAMVHGGPYPASTNFGATSVGTLAIRRWLRPVCYQNLPPALLPADTLDTQDGPSCAGAPSDTGVDPRARSA